MQLCQYFGNLISNCAGPFDTSIIASDLTEVNLTEEGKLDSICTYYSGLPSANLNVSQIGGEINLPINIAELPIVEEF